MKKVISCMFEFDEDDDEGVEAVIKDVEASIEKCKKKPKTNVTVHDCYHDEGKACKNLKVVINDERY